MDDLTAPLGQTTRQTKRFAIPVIVPRAFAALLAMMLLAFFAWALVVDDPYGGEPMAIVSADVRAPPANTGPDQPAVPPPAAAAAPQVPPGGTTVTIIDGMSGKRQDVVIGDQSAAPPGVDPRLIETSRHGAIPKAGPNGLRAAEAYARPLPPGATGPRVAIVLTGLGISTNGTSQALAKLPGPVTLAFSPYAGDLARWVGRARGDGHEVLLQVPMEPFDYPENDSGPQTLLTSQPPEQNVDRLHWFMSRMQGYVGVANSMGARFTASEAALGPAMRDIAKRGLIYFDDGSSARSLAGQIAGANQLAFAKADLVLDAAPTPAAIDAALARLELLARDRGTAVATASALPVSIERIAQWAKSAAGRGLVLVPISAVANRPKSS